MAGPLEYPTESFNGIVNSSSSQAAPHLRLIACDAGLSRGLLDFLNDFECADSAAAEKNGIRVGSIDFERKALQVRGSDGAELNARFQIQSLNVQDLKSLFVQKLCLVRVDLVQVGRPHHNLLGSNFPQRVHDRRGEAHGDRPRRSPADFHSDAPFPNNYGARRAIVTDDVGPGVGLQSRRRVGHLLNVPRQSFVGRVIVRLEPRHVHRHTRCSLRHVKEVGFGTKIGGHEDESELGPVVASLIEFDGAGFGFHL